MLSRRFLIPIAKSNVRLFSAFLDSCKFFLLQVWKREKRKVPWRLRTEGAKQNVLTRFCQKKSFEEKKWKLTTIYIIVDKAHVAERAKLGIVPQPLNANQTSELVKLLKQPSKEEEKDLYHLISERVPPGVDEAAYVKAAFLAAITKGEATSPLISKEQAVKVSQQ